MKAELTMRAALAMRLPAVARSIGRLRRWRGDVLAKAGHKAGKGNVVLAAGLVVLWLCVG